MLTNARLHEKASEHFPPLIGRAPDRKGLRGGHVILSVYLHAITNGIESAPSQSQDTQKETAAHNLNSEREGEDGRHDEAQHPIRVQSSESMP